MATTIQVKESTLNRLKGRKQYGRETYDELLNKLLDHADEGDMREDAIESIKKGLEDIRRGKTRSIESVARDYGVKLG